MLIFSSFRSSPSPIRFSIATAHNFNSKYPINVQQMRQARTVRVILTEDLPTGKGYAGEVHHVKPGFARNYLIPRKKALYAIPKNFERVGMPDPDLLIETIEEKKNREEMENDEDVKAADLLRHYFRNKQLTIWRNIDESVTNVDSQRLHGTPIHPGKVDHQDVRSKLSKQLKIDLQPHEKVQILPKPVSHSTLDKENSMEKYLDSFEEVDEGTDCPVQLKALGEYLVKINLRGEEVVGLKLNVVKR